MHGMVNVKFRVLSFVSWEKTIVHTNLCVFGKQINKLLEKKEQNVSDLLLNT